MDQTLPDSAQRVQESLERLGLPVRVITMPQGTRTAVDASHAIGCATGQIVKSIVFRGGSTGRPILVLVSGPNRVATDRLADYTGEPLDKADADFVRAHTGYAIGGVPPLGFSTPIETWIDEDLLEWEEVWAAAGTPFAVFGVQPQLLVDATGGKVVKIRS